MNRDFPFDVDLSILIVNYNGGNFLGPCIDSIQEYVAIPHEIIVVDNASHDGSVNFLETNYPGVRVIASPTNLGFTGGNNLAAKEAKGLYLLLLNNDTVICSVVDPLIDLMESRAEVGVLGCSLVYDDKTQQESIGYLPSVLSLVLTWTALSRFFTASSIFKNTVYAGSSLYKRPSVEVEWVSGAFLLTRANLWHQLDGLDEHYFMYMEDIDYCKRILASGKKVIFSNKCEVVHFEGAGQSWRGEQAIVNSTNSYLVYVAKHCGRIPVLVLRLLLSQVFIVRSLAHFSAAIFGMDLNGYEKAGAFRRAAFRLILRGVH